MTQPSSMFSHGLLCLALCSASAQADPTPSLNPSSLSQKKKCLPTAKEQTPYLPVISVEGRLNWGLALQVCHSNYNRLQAPSLSKACHKVAMLWFWLENSKVTSAVSIEKYPAPTWQTIAFEKKKRYGHIASFWQMKLRGLKN